MQNSWNMKKCFDTCRSCIILATLFIVSTALLRFDLLTNTNPDSHAHNPKGPA